MFLARWRAKRAKIDLIDQIHGEIVTAAREPTLFRELGVPDDLDGRFEMMTLHAGLALRRLSQIGESAAALSQELVDRVFQGFEDALREMSISDAGVSKRMKSMAAAFYGRSKVYAEALDADDATSLAAALARNAYRAGENVSGEARALAASVIAKARALKSVSLADFLEGRFRFPSVPGDET